MGNEALWRELVELWNGHLVEWRWVRGHAGQPQNEYANLLATRAAAAQTSSGGAIPSRFDEWLTGERAKGRMTLDPFPLPESEAFQPSRPLPGVKPASLF